VVTDTDSVHLTFGIHTPKGRDFFDWIRSEMMSDVLFREDILTIRGPEAVAEQERVIKSRLCEIINRSSVPDFLDHILSNREQFDVFQMGPAPEIHEGTLLAPILRYRGAWQQGAANEKPNSPETERILAFMIDNPLSTAGEIRRGIGDVLDQDALNAILAELVANCWIEIVS